MSQLPDRPAKYFINQLLVPDWNPSIAKGYDLITNRNAEAYLPVATTIDNVSAVYPSLIVQYSNETSGGQSTYDFIGENGPGQLRQGTLLCTARAQDSDNGYTGDSNNFSAQPAHDIVQHIIEAVEQVAQDNAGGGGTEFEHIGSQRGPDAPDDDEEDGTVRIANCQISYSWIREA